IRDQIRADQRQRSLRFGALIFTPDFLRPQMRELPTRERVEVAHLRGRSAKQEHNKLRATQFFCRNAKTKRCAVCDLGWRDRGPIWASNDSTRPASCR